MIIFKLQKKLPKFQEAIFERRGLKKQKRGCVEIDLNTETPRYRVVLFYSYSINSLCDFVPLCFIFCILTHTRQHLRRNIPLQFWLIEEPLDAFLGRFLEFVLSQFVACHFAITRDAAVKLLEVLLHLLIHLGR